MQNCPDGRGVLYQDVLKASREEGDHTQDTMEAAKALERNLNQALWHLRALGSALRDPQLRTSGEPLPGEEVKLIKKMGDT
ncbi:Ferritin light chain [Myotis davidii]|uniref:Ferritin light chain n=1 Tax=Myotis davidii TaxID=225400 RepID=L5M3S1_MYODS|nr:Ferritin light chain [Myotis davidii]